MMISPADDEPDPRRNTAQIRFADVFRNARLTKDPGDVRDRPVGADAHILVDAELDAAHAELKTLRRRLGQRRRRLVDLDGAEE